MQWKNNFADSTVATVCTEKHRNCEIFSEICTLELAVLRSWLCAHSNKTIILRGCCRWSSRLICWLTHQGSQFNPELKLLSVQSFACSSIRHMGCLRVLHFHPTAQKCYTKEPPGVNESTYMCLTPFDGLATCPQHCVPPYN